MIGMFSVCSCLDMCDEMVISIRLGFRDVISLMLVLFRLFILGRVFMDVGKLE